VADAYEAMRSPRSYRLIPLSKQEAIMEIGRNSGTQFDPKVVDAFMKVVDRL
jgi:HD-GYP domain-containing protein (c-di-GMP phosphodiesterase class II)